MTSQSQIFISHTDDQVGNAMQDVIQRAFDGRVRPFNTSRSARGLSSGVRIDEGLLESLQGSNLFLSLWTPGGVARPAWMCWELGVAGATRTTVLVGRALGVAVDHLPLGLGARFANDLGDEDSLVRMVEDMAEILKMPADTARVRERFASSGYSAFYARRCVTSKVHMTIHREYLLVENTAQTDLSELRIVPNDVDGMDAGISRSLDRALHKNGRRLTAAERLVTTRPNGTRGEDGSIGSSWNGDVVVTMEWNAPEIGREWSEITIFTDTE